MSELERNSQPLLAAMASVVGFQSGRSLEANMKPQVPVSTTGRNSLAVLANEFTVMSTLTLVDQSTGVVVSEKGMKPEVVKAAYGPAWAKCARAMTMAGKESLTMMSGVGFLW